MGLEKPMLFNTEMVKAIMEGRKTQTRRIIKKKYSNTDIGHMGEGSEILYPDIIFEIQNDVPEPVINDDGSRRVHLKAYEEIKKPYEIGDVIYVRETWLEHEGRYYFKADTPIDKGLRKEFKWKPSIHMPKQAARIFLKVNDIRAERLQDISEVDALKEGFEEAPEIFTSKELFQAEWESIYKNWDENPWIWVIEFEKM